jgi:uncharacterized protein (TIGR00299 family) protein
VRLAHLDAFSGVSGDMTVGALLDCGLDLADLERELGKLPVEGYRLRVEQRERSGIRATKFVVDVAGHDKGGPAHDHPHRPYRMIRRMIEESALAARVRELSLRVFERLALAEGKVHGVDPEEVEFHEVGAVDSIVDVVGACWGFAAHGIDEITVSPLPLGKGLHRAAHGPLPIPGPATAELLRGFPVRLGDGEAEMVTPTGAAIVAALGRPAAASEPLVVDRIGYGAGDMEFRDRPNLLRILLGTRAAPANLDSLLVLETNVDDLNPEIYEYVIERLFADGARDVYLVPIHMKKGRPGVLLSVLCDPERRDALAAILFAETSTLGVRIAPVSRIAVEREVREVECRYGRVRVKIGHAPNGARNVAPEYEDCKRLAAASGTPLKVVYQEALRAALDS